MLFVDDAFCVRRIHICCMLPGLSQLPGTVGVGRGNKFIENHEKSSNNVRTIMQNHEKTSFHVFHKMLLFEGHFPKSIFVEGRQIGSP